MQKFSLLTIVCCLTLMFTACQKETLLETNSKNPTSTNISSTNNNSTKSNIQKYVKDEDAIVPELDASDSASIANTLLKAYKVASQDAAGSCFAPNPNNCGPTLVFRSCYWSYQIWNDPTNLYIDLYFPSSVIGWKTDCNGRKCQYYVQPCINLDLFDAAGNKLGTVVVANSNITVTESRVTFDIASLIACFPTVKCVALSGSFYRMKKCGGCSPCRVGTVCISPLQYCLQSCAPVCPTVNEINVDRLKVCGSGAIKGTVTVDGDASKTATVWTVDGQTYSGNTVSIALPLNSTCSTISKNITAKVICTTDQSVLAERSFTVDVNPALTASVNVDNSSCNATIDISCPSDIVDITWTYGTESGTGNTIQVGSSPETVNYTISKSGCSYTGSIDNVICLPLLKSYTPNSDK